jgi:protein-tyrosine phosphatase
MWGRWLAHVERNQGTWRGWVRALLAEGEWLVGRLDQHCIYDPSNVRRLVFVCLGNINRSAFAAAVARARGLHCASIGLAAGTGLPAFPMAVEQAHRMGYDLRGHATTDLSDYVHQPGDLLLAMEVRHVGRLIAAGLPAGRIVLLGHWATPRRIHLHDPHTLSPQYFSTCFTLIESAVRQLPEPAGAP